MIPIISIVVAIGIPAFAIWKMGKAAEASVSIFSHQLHILYNSCNYGAVYD